MRTNTGWLLGAMVGSLLAAGATLQANGEEFFAIASGRPKLAYFGQLRDRTTNRAIPTLAIIVVTDRASGMTFPFPNDRPGHYRSPDIGEALTALGAVVDPKNFEMLVSVEGYKNVRLTRLPGRKSGAVEVPLKLEPENGAEQAAGSVVADSTSGPAAPGSSKQGVVMVCGLAGLVLIGAGLARTLGPRLSTTR